MNYKEHIEFYYLFYRVFDKLEIMKHYKVYIADEAQRYFINTFINDIYKCWNSNEVDKIRDNIISDLLIVKDILRREKINKIKDGIRTKKNL